MYALNSSTAKPSKMTRHSSTLVSRSLYYASIGACGLLLAGSIARWLYNKKVDHDLTKDPDYVPETRAFVLREEDHKQTYDDDDDDIIELEHVPDRGPAGNYMDEQQYYHDAAGDDDDDAVWDQMMLDDLLREQLAEELGREYQPYDNYYDDGIDDVHDDDDDMIDEEQWMRDVERRAAERAFQAAHGENSK
eukprot:PhM_4_TR9595/c0_g1_i1/m.36516